MTSRKHLKQLVRTRMHKTGESYATARRHVVREEPAPARDPRLRWHFPGNVPATTALRVLLAHSGVQSPETGKPFTEAMLFGIAGGPGIGVFSFFYEKEDFASFFIAGRHLWQDDLAYLREALERLGIAPAVAESSGAKTADKQLRDALARGPCVAWVDAAHLPHRAMPERWSGGGYHVVTVYGIDADRGHAWIGDLTDEPLALPLEQLAAARARIQKQKHRLLSIPPSASPPDLDALVRGGLAACHEGLLGRGGKPGGSRFSLEALRQWAGRMHGSREKDGWQRVFARPRLFTGLTSIHDFIEHYGTGGGLCRPLFADFLSEAADALGRSALRALAQRYARLGRDWSDLARAALPEDVPLLREVRELCTRKAELTLSGGDTGEIRAAWERLGELEREARSDFPLTDSQCEDLRADLQTRIRALFEAESEAHAALAAEVA